MEIHIYIGRCGHRRGLRGNVTPQVYLSLSLLLSIHTFHSRFVCLCMFIARYNCQHRRTFILHATRANKQHTFMHQSRSQIHWTTQPCTSFPCPFVVQWKKLCSRSKLAITQTRVVVFMGMNEPIMSMGRLHFWMVVVCVKIFLSTVFTAKLVLNI